MTPFLVLKNPANTQVNSKTLNFRIKTLALIAGLGLLVLVGRLGQLQVFQGENFRALADGNRQFVKTLLAPRGIIFDASGNPLTQNSPVFKLLTHCQKIDNKGFFGKPQDRCSSFQFLTHQQALQIEARGGDEVNYLLTDNVRQYLYGEVTGHLTGFLGEVSPEEIQNNKNLKAGDLKGRGGLEDYYDELLRGENGQEIIEVDALGYPLRTLFKLQPRAGQNISLSLHLGLQQTAASALKNVAQSERYTGDLPVRGAVIVSKPQDGQILALYSSPSFDPNLFTQENFEVQRNSPSPEEILNDTVKTPLLNRAIAAVYPPGSTFKPLVAAAALEEGKINEATLIEDIGIIRLGRFSFPNWLWLKKGTTDGFLNLVTALKRSNDIFFYKVGERLGLDLIGSWAAKFGFGHLVGIDLPGEIEGLVPSREWRERQGRSWFLGDTYHLAIGQGDLLATPLQINTMTAALANGGKLCQPSLLKPFLSQESQDQRKCQNLFLSEKTLSLIQQGMMAACEEGGTGWPLFGFKVHGRKISLACKTGTAEHNDPQKRTHAWFTAYAPADNPELVVTVLVENGGEGSDVAAPVAKKIFEYWFGNQ